jgi:hypothetical protein
MKVLEDICAIIQKELQFKLLSTLRSAIPLRNRMFWQTREQSAKFIPPMMADKKIETGFLSWSQFHCISPGF